MKPVWDLRLGDCLDPVTGMASLDRWAAGQGADDKNITHVITDPPYSERVHENSRTRRGIGSTYQDAACAVSRRHEFDFEHLTPEVIRAASSQIGRLVCRWALVFSDSESSHLWSEAMMEDGGLEYVRTCFWRKSNGAPQFTGDRPAVSCEAITVCASGFSGRKRWNGGGKQGFYEHPIVLNRGGNDPRLHTAQKPVELMEALVRDFTDPGDLILDPFAGSGTTGVAAIRLGRRFIGWEKDPKYHAIAIKRLTAAREQLELCA